jgi:transposase-like protein
VEIDEDVGTCVDPSERAQHAGGGGSTPERRRRMSARRKQDAVLRLLRGDDLELLSRHLGVTAADLSDWRDTFLAASEVSLKTRPADAQDAEIGRQALIAGGRLTTNRERTVDISQHRAVSGLPRTCLPNDWPV